MLYTYSDTWNSSGYITWCLENKFSNTGGQPVSMLARISLFPWVKMVQTRRIASTHPSRDYHESATWRSTTWEFRLSTENNGLLDEPKITQACIAELDRECKWRSYQKINTIWHHLKVLKIFLQMVASQLYANEITGFFFLSAESWMAGLFFNSCCISAIQDKCIRLAPN